MYSRYSNSKFNFMLIRTEIVSSQGARRSILCLGQSVYLDIGKCISYLIAG